MLKFNLSHCAGFIEVDLGSVQGLTKISENQCRLLIGNDLEDCNVIDIAAEFLTVIREIGVTSFKECESVGSEEIK